MRLLLALNEEVRVCLWLPNYHSIGGNLWLLPPLHLMASLTITCHFGRWICTCFIVSSRRHGMERQSVVRYPSERTSLLECVYIYQQSTPREWGLVCSRIHTLTSSSAYNLPNPRPEWWILELAVSCEVEAEERKSKDGPSVGVTVGCTLLYIWIAANWRMTLLSKCANCFLSLPLSLQCLFPSHPATTTHSPCFDVSSNSLLPLLLFNLHSSIRSV